MTYVLILFIYAGPFAHTDAVTVTNVPGFKNSRRMRSGWKEIAHPYSRNGERCAIRVCRAKQPLTLAEGEQNGTERKQGISDRQAWQRPG